MSLKFFHVVFVAAVVALALFCGGLLVRRYLQSDEVMMLFGGIGAFAAAGGMLVYGSWFLRKMKAARIT